MISRSMPLALAALALSLAACGKSGGEASNAPAADTSPGAPAAAPSPADIQKKLASLPAPFNAGDPVTGKAKFAVCRACHTIEQGGPAMTGPNLYGLIGRKAASAPGYTYSPALIAAGFTWDAARLDAWLTDPRAYVAGTKMTYVGVKDATDRRDLIAYLRTQSAD